MDYIENISVHLNTQAGHANTRVSFYATKIWLQQLLLLLLDTQAKLSFIVCDDGSLCQVCIMTFSSVWDKNTNVCSHMTSHKLLYSSWWKSLHCQEVTGGTAQVWAHKLHNSCYFHSFALYYYYKHATYNLWPINLLKFFKTNRCRERVCWTAYRSFKNPKYNQNDWFQFWPVNLWPEAQQSDTTISHFSPTLYSAAASLRHISSTCPSFIPCLD